MHTTHTNHAASDSPQHAKQSYEKCLGCQGGLGATTFEKVILDFLSILNVRENTHHPIISRGRMGDPNKRIYFVTTITSIISIGDLLESVQWLWRYSTFSELRTAPSIFDTMSNMAQVTVFPDALRMIFPLAAPRYRFCGGVWSRGSPRGDFLMHTCVTKK